MFSRYRKFIFDKVAFFRFGQFGKKNTLDIRIPPGEKVFGCLFFEGFFVATESILQKEPGNSAAIVNRNLQRNRG